MASSSKQINMPLMFAVSIGATVALLATTMFGLAWYQYESRVVLNEQVLVDEDGLPAPTHDQAYERELAKQEANLGDIDVAITSIVVEHVKPEAHEGHGQ